MDEWVCLRTGQSLLATAEEVRLPPPCLSPDLLVCRMVAYPSTGLYPAYTTYVQKLGIWKRRWAVVLTEHNRRRDQVRR